jgi:hypothetical protein
MKKMLVLFAIILTVLMTINTQADSPRKGLIEEGTNTYCGPCAASNPAFQAWILENLDVLVPVVYHPSFPGSQDIFYLDNTAMNTNRVVDYYRMSGVPHFHYNGVANAHPANAQSIVNLAALRGETSPLTIKINETRNGSTADVAVEVNSSQAISGKKLRIVVLEYYIQYSAPNGEKDFYWIARQMLPTHDGIDFSIGANETKTFNQSFNLKSNWQKAQIYVAAFIQDDGTKNVLQAEHNLKTIKAPLTPDITYNKVDESSTMIREITVQNPTSTTMQVNLSIPTATSFIPNGWEAKLDNYLVSVAPNNSKKVKLTIKTAAQAGFAMINILAEPNVTSGIVVNTQTNVYALSNNTENAIYYGFNRNILSSYNTLMTLPKYGIKTAALPLSKEVIINYPLKDFKLVFLAFDQPGRSVLTNSGTAFQQDLISGLTQHVSNGGKILITGELEAYNASQTSASTQGRLFVNSTLGLTYATTPVLRVTLNSQGTAITGITPFPAKGVTGDPIGSGVNMTLNNYTNINSDPYIIFTDILKSNDLNKAVPFLYYDNDPNKIGGIRTTNGNSKSVFLSFGFEAIKDQTQRAGFMTKVLDWLFAGGSQAVGPKIEFSNSTYNFDKVNINESKDMTMTIQNTGDQPLTVNSMLMDADYDPTGAFKFKSGGTTPFTIQPNSSKDVVLTFNPKATGDFTGIITIESNSTSDATALISLEGKGIAGAGPAIASNKASLDFGTVSVGNTIIADVTISNSGTQDLNISSILVTDDADNVFSFVTGANPVILQPTQERTVTVKFTAKSEKNFTGNITVTSNASNQAEYKIGLKGNGTTTSVKEEVTSEDGVITVKATPNPMGLNGMITYSINNIETGSINMYLVDMNGRNIMNLLTGSVNSGVNTLEFNTSALSSGTYVIIAQVNGSIVKLPIVIAK